jgi:hypothetical protein
MPARGRVKRVYPRTSPRVRRIRNLPALKGRNRTRWALVPPFQGLRICGFTTWGVARGSCCVALPQADLFGPFGAVPAFSGRCSQTEGLLAKSGRARFRRMNRNLAITEDGGPARPNGNRNERLSSGTGKVGRTRNASPTVGDKLNGARRWPAKKRSPRNAETLGIPRVSHLLSARVR